MSPVFRLSAWRTRWHERKNEKLIALSKEDKTYMPDIQGQLDNAVDTTGMGQQVWALDPRHGAEEGRPKH